MKTNAQTQRWLEDVGRALRTHYGVDEAPSSAPGPDPRFLSDVPYTVVHEVARGGMGRILRVVDARFDRTLAMKVPLSPAGRDASRLLAEARLLGRLQHPGIVPVHDVGTDADGAPYFTMQLVEGESLAELLARARAGVAAQWPQPRILETLAKVCDTVAFAHEQGSCTAISNPAT